jgi:hypothetical protein
MLSAYSFPGANPNSATGIVDAAPQEGIKIRHIAKPNTSSARNAGSPPRVRNQ